MTPEGKVKKEIKEGLDALGDQCLYTMPVMAGYGKRGVDFIGCFKGRFFAVEAKRSDRKTELTGIQKDFLNRVVLAGGIAIMAKSWEEVERVIIHEHYSTHG